MDQYFMGKPVLHEIYRGWTGKYRFPAAELCIPAYLLCKNSSCIRSIGQYNGTMMNKQRNCHMTITKRTSVLLRRSTVSKAEQRKQLEISLKDFPKHKIVVCKPSRRKVR